MLRALLIILIVLFCAAPALASNDARQLLHDGHYEAARKSALATDTIDGLMIATEAMAAEIMLLKVEDAKDHARDAIKLAEEALERDPDNVEATFMRALHLGFRTRSSSPMTILLKGLVGKTRDAIEDFDQVAPGDPRADALYGAWHLGIVRAAGDGRFGASLGTGMAHYDAAVDALPDDIVVMSNYAFSLIVMEDPALIPRAKELLQQIETTPPNGATERETRDRMLTLFDVINDPDILQDRAAGLLNTEEVEP